MSLPIYIAGGSSEIELCQRMIDTVSSAGGRITYDWTRDPGWKLGRPLTMREREDAGGRDLAAIMNAWLFWLMLPVKPSEGASTELGVALVVRALGEIVRLPDARRVIVSGPMTDSRLFPALADHIFADHDQALAHVLDLLGASVDGR